MQPETRRLISQLEDLKRYAAHLDCTIARVEEEILEMTRDKIRAAKREAAATRLCTPATQASAPLGRGPHLSASSSSLCIPVTAPVARHPYAYRPAGVEEIPTVAEAMDIAKRSSPGEILQMHACFSASITEAASIIQRYLESSSNSRGRKFKGVHACRNIITRMRLGGYPMTSEAELLEATARRILKIFPALAASPWMPLK